MTKLIGEQVLMRIFIGEGDRYEHKPLYEALVELLRHEGFAGATVLRGVCGFGANRVYHTQKLLDLSADLPLVVEVVDTLVHVKQHVYLGHPLRRVEPDRQVHIVFVLHRARTDIRQVQRRPERRVRRYDVLHRAACNGRREREVNAGGGQ